MQGPWKIIKFWKCSHGTSVSISSVTNGLLAGTRKYVGLVKCPTDREQVAIKAWSGTQFFFFLFCSSAVHFLSESFNLGKLHFLCSNWNIFSSGSYCTTYSKSVYFMTALTFFHQLSMQPLHHYRSLCRIWTRLHVCPLVQPLLRANWVSRDVDLFYSRHYDLWQEKHRYN